MAFTAFPMGAGRAIRRMLNVNEFQSLLDLDNTRGPALPTAHPFLNVSPANYWSCSSVQIAPPLGWYCGTGGRSASLRSDCAVIPPAWRRRAKRSASIRTIPCRSRLPCSRTVQDGEIHASAAWPDPRFTDNKNGSVTDNLTGLVWPQDACRFGTRRGRPRWRPATRLQAMAERLRTGAARMATAESLRVVQPDRLQPVQPGASSEASIQECAQFVVPVIHHRCVRTESGPLRFRGRRVLGMGPQECDAEPLAGAAQDRNAALSRRMGAGEVNPWEAPVVVATDSTIRCSTCSPRVRRASPEMHRAAWRC